MAITRIAKHYFICRRIKMGTVNTTIRIRNILTNSDSVELESKIDTGATLLVLPGAVAKELGFPVIQKQLIKYANEKTEARDVVWGVEVTICDRKGVFEAVVEPKKNMLSLGRLLWKRWI
ncbi:MAG: aspartyl protease family protein [bacterium]